MNLTVSRLRFSYNHRPILSEISFCLPRGRILGVLGVNGAGKSTLLKCINRLLRPKGGLVTLGGKDVARMRGDEIARHFGYVPQRETGEPLTVFDTVLLGRRPHHKGAPTTRDLGRVEDILQRLSLGPMAHRPTDRLSGGEFQKVLLARALVQEPEVLLLDEPTSSLDLKGQVQVMKLVAEIAREREMAVVVSLHDLNLAYRFSDDLLLIRDGTVHTFSHKRAVTSRDIEEVYGVPVILREIDGQRIVIPQETSAQRMAA